MLFEEFKDCFIERLYDEFGENSDIRVTDVIKNNGIKLTGVTVIFKGVQACPSIYIEHFYDDYNNGDSFEDIMSSVFEILRNCRLEEELDLSIFDSYNSIKDKILCKLVNTEKNKELLASAPHINFLDLSVVFYVIMTSVKHGMGSILIKDNIFSDWQVSVDQMFKDAKENNKRLLGSKIEPIEEVLRRMVKGCSQESDLISDLDDLNMRNGKSYMYVLTNSQLTNGAASLLDNEALCDFSNEINSDFYIIPSSIHELILVPVKNDLEDSTLKSMVKEINAKEVSPQEVLSDNIYFFSRSLNKVVGV